MDEGTDAPYTRGVRSFRDRLVATIHAARPILELPDILVIGSEVPNLLEPGLAATLVVSLVASPLLLAQAFRTYPHWWVDVRLRVRAAVLHGQTGQHRLERTPPGEVVARTMDADRLARYTDRWVDFVNGLLVAVITGLIAQSWLAGAVLLAVMVASALASTLTRASVSTACSMPVASRRPLFRVSSWSMARRPSAVAATATSGFSANAFARRGSSDATSPSSIVSSELIAISAWPSSAVTS